jgi:prevent-host-death family protein
MMDENCRSPQREGIMHNGVQEVQSLTHFKRNTGDMLAHLKETGNPVVLTVNGKEEVIVQNAEAYRRLQAQAERAELMEVLNQSMEDIKAGRTRPAREFVESLGREP